LAQVGRWLGFFHAKIVEGTHLDIFLQTVEELEFWGVPGIDMGLDCRVEAVMD